MKLETTEVDHSISSTIDTTTLTFSLSLVVMFLCVTFLSHFILMNILPKNGPATLLNFSLTSPNPTRYGPRIGNIILKRPRDPPDDGSHLQISTPNLISTTSRGVVPHISRDHYKLTDAILWVNVPFETL